MKNINNRQNKNVFRKDVNRAPIPKQNSGPLFGQHKDNPFGRIKESFVKPNLLTPKKDS